ncbi:MAG TPA: hypothetical protein VJ623_11860 [Holophagaceae bacterium]|nr:hypothetical protein [Holophagaceae bacterium]
MSVLIWLPLLVMGLVALAVLTVLVAHQRFMVAESGRQREAQRRAEELSEERRLARELIRQFAHDVSAPAKDLMRKAKDQPELVEQAWIIVSRVQEAMEWVESDATTKEALVGRVNLLPVLDYLVSYAPAGVPLELEDRTIQSVVVKGAVAHLREALVKLVEHTAAVAEVEGGRVILEALETKARVSFLLGVDLTEARRTFALVTAANWIQACGGTLAIGGPREATFTVHLPLTGDSSRHLIGPVTAPQRVVA